MMAVRVKQLGEAIANAPTDRQTAALDKARALSRRQQALLAAAGMEAVGMAWIVARVAKGRDLAVEKSFTDAGIDAWVPVVQVSQAWRGRQKKGLKRTVEKLVWDGYVFVHCAMWPAGWAGLFAVDGVVALLGVEGRPIALDPNEIKRLRDMLARDKGLKDKASNALKAGDQVVVCDGPFASFPGIVSLLGAAGRVKVDVAIFGRGTPVDLDLAQIRKVG